MKHATFLLLFITMFTMAFSKMITINEKAVMAFKQSFPGISNETWAVYANFSEVYFEQNGIKNRIQYDENGTVIRTRRDYLADQLAPFIKSKVIQQYSNMKIAGVTELTTGTEFFYQVVLEDSGKWITLESNAIGDMHIIEKIKKLK
jgi:hypothetical protein